MTPIEAESLRALLAQQEQLATAHKDARAYVSAHGFLRFVQSQPQLAALLEDSLDETFTSRLHFITDCRRSLSLLQKFWAETQPLALSRSVDLSATGDGPLAAIVKEILDDEDLGTARRACSQLDAIFDAIRDAIHDAAENAATEQREDLRKRARTLHQLRQFYVRTTLQGRCLEDMLVGEAHVELKGYVQTLLPRIVTNHLGHPGIYLPDVTEAEAIWKDIDEAKRSPPREGGYDVSAHRICDLIRRISVGLQTALVQRRTQRALIRRFAARCETLEAKRLRRVPARELGRVEAALTRDFARYLFDAGYSPVLNPEISGLKPDVVHIAQGPALYVEVKQYGAATIAKLRRAVDQVRSTWQAFANVFDTPEAVLLVFRTGGVSLDVVPEIKTGPGRLLIQVVDVAPRSQAGSRARTPLTVTEEDLIGGH